MSKGKSITLLSIISVLMAFVLVMTFARFSVGEVKQYNSLLGAVELDYDLEGGVAYTLSLAKDNEEDVGDNIDSVIRTLENRLSALGYEIFSVKAVKSVDEEVTDYDIRIETKSTDTVSSDIAVASAFGQVEFFGGESANPTTEILTDEQVVADAYYAGSVTNADNSTSYAVNIKFTSYAINELIKAIDSAESSYYLEIKMNDSVLLSGSSPITKDILGSGTVTVTSTSEASARQMALQMKDGGLKYKYDVSDGVKISAPYGEGVATKCAVAIITLSILLIALMIVAYKGLGVSTALSSLLFILIEGWLLIGVPGIVLSMGGVIGIMSATVLNAICMVVLAQRVKDEYAGSQKTVRAAVKKGFNEALVPTISVCVVAGLVSLVLLAFTAGVVKGFAITFGIGAGVALISSLLFTRMFNAIITPLVKNKEKFFGFKRVDVESKTLVEEA